MSGIQEKKAELKRQIAALQAQVGEMEGSDPESPSHAGPSSPKRRKLDAVLARLLLHQVQKPRRPDTKSASYQSSRHALKTLNSTATLKKPAEDFVPAKPAASTLLSKLATVNLRPLDAVEAEPLRDERLAIIENLEVGPVDHKPSFDDPHFQQLEPNSGIRLSSRKVPHEDLQDHLRGRYYLSPSRLYSAVRLSPNKQGYDVPVAGDWITIAVVAERGPYKYSKAPRKKYINIKLVDFGAPARSFVCHRWESRHRGDAMLSLLLFESDGFDTVPQDEGRPKKVYRGGSRGAFEEMCDLKEGDVVALLNPRVLKPFQRSNDTPHPHKHPRHNAGIRLVDPDHWRAKISACAGRSNGTARSATPGATDVSDVCEWHVQHAVEQRRASRPEFSVGTSGMSTTAFKRKPEYDPRRKWGLKPLDDSSGTTGGSGVDARDSMFIAEGDARVLKALQGRDSEGMKAVMKAREVGLAEKDEQAVSKGKGKKKAKPTADAASDAAEAKIPAKSAFSAEVLKNLGFDPTIKPGQRRHEDSAMKKKLEELALLQSSRKPIRLGPRPGEKVRSGVVAPKAKPKKKPFDLTHLHSDSDSDMPASVPLPRPEVDLDDD
ncbi:hypothetical protein C8R47DRAFT_1326780 [Mycena vitilis]|nr:hypothetical protein C8R47DRAFT_1326780 [Mycena vitilis]